jgi:hypothetical protein
MAPAQFPIDGKLGVDFKITSLMGFRIHPVLKTKKHHNGTDIWSKHEPCWIEAPYDAKVIKVGNNPSGFGNSVTLQMKINGKFYVSVFAHMQDGSVKVKVGQKIAAGTPLGKMGTTGMSTGKHLHWELQLGKAYHWNDKGKDFIEPIAFFKALIAQEKAVASAKVVAVDTDPVAPAPTHDEAQAEAVEAEYKAKKAGAAPAVKPAVAPTPAPTAAVDYPDALSKEMALDVNKFPKLAPGAKNRYVVYVQKKLKLDATGEYNEATVNAVIALQKKHGFVADGVFGKLTWGKIINLP